jgi:SAM-dependent methyltransferase
MPEIRSQDYHDYYIKDGKFIGEFEQMYQNIDDPWGTVEHVGWLKNDLLLALLSHIASGSTVEKVLHAGCALGALTARVHQTLGMGTQVWGCDISPTAINKSAAQHPGINFFAHDLSQIERAPFPAGFFDLILMAETMWYVLPWLDKIFQGFHTMLRPGGHLVMQQYFLQPGQQSYGNEIVETPDDLIKFIVKAGFKVLHRVDVDAFENHTLLFWASLE